MSNKNEIKNIFMLGERKKEERSASSQFSYILSKKSVVVLPLIKKKIPQNPCDSSKPNSKL